MASTNATSLIEHEAHSPYHALILAAPRCARAHASRHARFRAAHVTQCYSGGHGSSERTNWYGTSQGLCAVTA